MIIQVKQEHIDNGYEGNCYRCPIALAIKDVVKDSAEVIVGINMVTFVAGKYFPPIPLSQEVENFIIQFDNGVKDLMPFSFELGPLSPIFEDLVKNNG